MKEARGRLLKHLCKWACLLALRAKRWLDVAALAIIATFFAMALNRIYVNFAPGIFRHLLGESSSELRFYVKIIIGAVVLFLTHRFLGYTPTHLAPKSALKWPPLPVAVSIGLYFVRYLPNIDSTVLYYKAITSTASNYLLGGYILWVIAQVLVSTSISKVRKAIEATSETDQIKKLIDGDKDLSAFWITSDDPITSPDEDKFELRHIAERILLRLVEGSSSLALHGDYGAGKTSICKLVEHHAKDQKLKMLFATTRCWGLEDAKHAQKAIIKAVVDQAKLHFDCAGIHNLPSEYVKAASDSVPWGGFFSVFAGEPPPSMILRRLSQVLTANGYRAVVILEDIDRNERSEFNVSVIHRMLMEIRDTASISFVMNISPAQSVDFMKLCDYIEPIPAPNSSVVRRLIHDVREVMLLKNSPGVVVDEPLEFMPAETTDLYERINPTVCGAIARLLCTPRLLKFALRQAKQQWQALHGEVSIDELLAVCALRVSSPDALGFAINNRNRRAGSLVTPQSASTDPEKQKLSESLLEEWDKLAATRNFDADAARIVLSWLFPQLAQLAFAEHPGKPRFQSVASSDCSEKYFYRLLTGTKELHVVSDQVVLSAMKESINGTPSHQKIAKLWVHNLDVRATFRNFIRPTQYNVSLPFLSALHTLESERHKGAASYESLSGIYELYGVVRDQVGPQIPDWAASECAAHMVQSARLANDIYHTWIDFRGSLTKDKIIVRTKIMEDLRATWPNIPPNEIADGFDAAYPFVLFHLMFTAGFANPETVPYGLPSDWAWAGSLLYAACEAAPTTMLPQIAIAMCKDEDRDRREPPYTIDTERLSTIFGVNTKLLIRFMAEKLTVDQRWEFGHRLRIELAIKAFKKAARELESAAPDRESLSSSNP